MTFEKPRRIIFYQLDGISATKVRSFCSDEANAHINKSIKENYIDEITKTGNYFTRCYGYDTTQNAFYKIFSGQSLCETPVSVTTFGRLLKIKQNLFRAFKKEGYVSNFFTNNYCNNLALPVHLFDRAEVEPFCYNLNKSKQGEEFWGLGNQKTVIFIHDLYTHDKDGKYAMGDTRFTMQEYEDLIEQNAKNLKNNLDFLKFDPEEDLLLLFSDHGMTIGNFSPKDKSVLSEERLKNWSYPGKDIKSRVLFSAINKNLAPKRNETVINLLDCVAETFLKFGFEDYRSRGYLSLGLNGEAITLNSGFFPNKRLKIAQRLIFWDRFYQFVYIRGNQEKVDKWIYQSNLDKIEYYDLKKDPEETNPLAIQKTSELPQKMQNYIKNYNRSRSFFPRHIISVILKKLLVFYHKNYTKNSLRLRHKEKNETA